MGPQPKLLLLLLMKSFLPNRIHRCPHWPHLWWPFRCSPSIHRCALSTAESTSKQWKKEPQWRWIPGIPEAVWCKVSSSASTHMTEAFHLLQHLVHLGHHITAPNLDGCVGAVPQGNVEHRTVLETWWRHDVSLTCLTCLLLNNRNCWWLEIPKLFASHNSGLMK